MLSRPAKYCNKSSADDAGIDLMESCGNESLIAKSTSTGGRVTFPQDLIEEVR